MTDINEWLDEYKTAVLEEFGRRVKFIGIQGSVGRGEDTESSDIDAVMILDTMDISDLGRYRSAVEPLPKRERLCGFVCGYDVLKDWDKADLFTLYFDTTPIFGSLDELRPYLTAEAAKSAVLTAACQVYHIVCHNFTHARKASTLENLRKTVFFTLRIEYYLRSGNFVRAKGALLPLLDEDERALLDGEPDLDALSEAMLTWAGKTAKLYGANPR